MRLSRLGVALLAWGAGGLLSAAAPSVPPKYAELYRGLERLLEAELAKPAPADTGPRPLAGADLLMANSNRGPVLLDPATLAAVGPCLDRFRELGLGWVRIELQYPMLRMDFPRHGEYLEFYRQVMQLAQARGLKVMLHVTVLFSDTPFSPFKGLYRGLDLDRFKREYRSMVRIVLRQLQPGGGIAATATVFRLDPYSFWQPLDQKFITLMLKLAREERIGLVAFFWSSELFAYLDHSPKLERMSYTKARQLHGRTAYQAILDGKFSPTGEYLRTLLQAGRADGGGP